VDFEGAYENGINEFSYTFTNSYDPIAIYIILRAIYLNVKFLMDMV
jgi:hypothetical protein